jgi:hypothetical protein
MTVARDVGGVVIEVVVDGFAVDETVVEAENSFKYLLENTN